MPLANFVNLILPHNGIKCWATLNNKRVVQHFVDSIEMLQQEIESAAKTPGIDVYHACASFKDDTSRRGQNALACKAFWLDIDCGAGKPYLGAEAGLAALDAFAEALGLPYSYNIYSGSGVHAYWPLTAEIPAEQWKPIAQRFKAATEAHGLQADPTRTADLSSILRPPGTFNHKRGTPEPVREVDGHYELISAEDFAACLPVAQAFALPAGAPPRAATHALSAAILGGASAAPSMTQGYGDGERTQALAKRAGYLLAKKHTPEETLAQCRAWNQLNTPPMDDEKLVHDVMSYARREAEKAVPAVAPTVAIDAMGELPPLDWPYLWHPVTRALCAKSKNAETDEITMEVISPYPIYLKDICRRESEVFISYIFRQYHPHNGWHEFVLPADAATGSNWKGAVTLAGANIFGQKFKNYVQYAAIKRIGERMDAIQYDQFGWKDDDTAFLIGNALIKNDGTTEYAYGGESLSERMKALSLAPNGSLAKWSAAGNKLAQPGFEPHFFTLICNMGAPLMHFLCGATDGGAILSLYSEGSGRGKSKTLEAVGSVWGKYDGLSTSGKDTINAKFAIIKQACNLPVYEEELNQRDPVLAADFVKDFTMGRDKNRAKRDGSVPYKDTRYQTIMVSASNRSLFETLKLSGDQGAMARVFELTLEKPENDDFRTFRTIVDEMAANHGYAGRALISCLLRPGCVEYLKKECLKWEKFYIERLETLPEHRYVVYLLVCARVIGPILNAAGILSFDVERVMRYGEDSAQNRIAEGTVNSSEALLNRYINENIFECLIMKREYKPKTINEVTRYPTRGLTMRLEQEPRRLFIAADPLREWLRKNGHDFNNFARKLEKTDVIINAKKLITLAAGTDLASGRVICLEVDLAAPSMSGVARMSEITAPEKQASSG